RRGGAIYFSCVENGAVRSPSNSTSTLRSASSSFVAPARASPMPSSNAAIDSSRERPPPSRRSTTRARRATMSSYFSETGCAAASATRVLLASSVLRFQSRPPTAAWPTMLQAVHVMKGHFGVQANFSAFLAAILRLLDLCGKLAFVQPDAHPLARLDRGSLAQRPQHLLARRERTIHEIF